jgi:hypothetical protein
VAVVAVGMMAYLLTEVARFVAQVTYALSIQEELLKPPNATHNAILPTTRVADSHPVLAPQVL